MHYGVLAFVEECVIDELWLKATRMHFIIANFSSCPGAHPLLTIFGRSTAFVNFLVQPSPSIRTEQPARLQRSPTKTQSATQLLIMPAHRSSREVPNTATSIHERKEVVFLGVRMKKGVFIRCAVSLLLSLIMANFYSEHVAIVALRLFGLSVNDHNLLAMRGWLGTGIMYFGSAVVVSLVYENILASRNDDDVRLPRWRGRGGHLRG